MNHSLPLFAYGTLMFPQVIRTVMGRAPRGNPAVAYGFSRLELIGQPFPGLVEAPDKPESAVEGLIYENLTEEEWAHLNDFEGSFYDLTEISVVRNGETIKALTYIVTPDRRGLLSDTPWNQDHFRTHHLDGFLTGQ